MIKLAGNLFASGILPSFVRNPQVAFAMMVKAHSFGLPEETAWDYFYENPYNKQIELKTTTKVALIAKAGGVIKTIENTNDKVTIECYRPTWGTETFSFSYAEAQQAGLVNRNQTYNKYTRDMLWARAVSRAAARMFPDVILGIDADDSSPQQQSTGSVAQEASPHVQLNAKEVIEKITKELEHEKSESKAQGETITVPATKPQAEEPKAPASEGAGASKEASAGTRARRAKVVDARRDEGAASATRIEPAGDGAADRERDKQSVDAGQSSSSSVAHADESHRASGIRAGTPGSGSEGQVGQHEPALPDNSSENPEFRHLKSEIESRIPGTTVTGRRHGSFDSGNPEHLTMVGVASKELMLSTDFKKQHGRTIIDWLDKANIDATQELITSELKRIVSELVPF